MVAQGDVKLERSLMRRTLENSKYLDELLDHEERLTRKQQRSVVKLNRYGIGIEDPMDALVELSESAPGAKAWQSPNAFVPYVKPRTCRLKKSSGAPGWNAGSLP